MKKLAITLTAAVLFFTASAFATRTEEVPGKVKTAFEKNFSAASGATWEKSENLYFVTFNWNASDVKAVFNADGELLSTSRKITVAQLPLKISLALEQKYQGYKIGDNAVEIITDDQASYHFAVSNDKKTISLSSNANGDLTEDNK